MKIPTISQYLPEPRPGQTCFGIKRELFTRILTGRGQKRAARKQAGQKFAGVSSSKTGTFFAELWSLVRQEIDEGF